VNDYNRIHTSDRTLFKQCRRKWDYQSPLRQNLEPKDFFNHYFFIGTGFHYALEMYHGYGKDPIQAFEDYYNCFDPELLTLDCQVAAEMVPGMFNHYINSWLPKRQNYKTLVVDGKPQVEVEVILEIKALSKIVGKPVHYSMRFDRVIEDEYGRLWIMDYKTMARFDLTKLETDPQISIYSWGGELYYKRPVEGFIYLQFKKALINDPKILKNGKLSVDKKQNTNYDRYLTAIQFKYGTLADATPGVLETLEHLRSKETQLGDEYIRYDLVRRSKANKNNQYKYVLAEGKEMLDPDVPIYPNQNRECFNFCNFRSACLAEDDNMDYQFILDNNFQKRQEEDDKWRNKIPK